jgi:ketosteroid isomerase-like protein
MTMTNLRQPGFSSLLLLCGALIFAPAADADDAADLTILLHEFLAGVSEAEVHDRFWADDLVYTSSRGTRTNKAEIMQGFDDADGADNGETGPVYAAEDIVIKVYGSTAVVAFTLVATGADAASQNYFNTGTFVKRAGRWQVVAWQATEIPDQ